MDIQITNNRYSFEQFVKSNTENISQTVPWLGLLSQDTHWFEIQDKVECAALLTNQCADAGWFIQPANINSEIIAKCNIIPGNYESTSIDIDTMMKEFFYHVLVNKDLFYKSVTPQALAAVNSFVVSRNPSFAQGWSQDELIVILNHNLSLLRQNYSISTLPHRSELSIEVIYGLMISHYGQKLIDEVPQLAILAVTIPFVNGLQELKIKELSGPNPLEKKRLDLIKKFNEMKNWHGKIAIDENMTMNQIIDTFKQAVQAKTVGSATRKKLKKLLKYIADEEFKRSKAYKDICFNIRKDIKQIHLKTNIDYRDYQPIEKLFFVGLSQSLNRLPTDIQVYNNGTLRNPRLHIVYPFLAKQYPELDKRDRATGEELLKELEFIANLIIRAKKYGYFVSDWQNNIARQWNVLRSQVIQTSKSLKQENQEILQVPPPLAFDLALDLNPEAHPFAITYGRFQGYGFQDSYQYSFDWFLMYSNDNEKNYFFSLLKTIPEKLKILEVIPQEIRLIKDQKEIMTKLDQFLEDLNQKDAQNPLIQAIKSYIAKRRGKLPEFLLKKIEKQKIKEFSSIALVFTVYDLYPNEQVFLDKVELPLPEKSEETDEDQQRSGIPLQDRIPQGYGGETNSKAQFIWGPVNYGGYSQIVRGKWY